MEEIRRISDNELDVNAGTNVLGTQIDTVIFFGEFVSDKFFPAAEKDQLAASTPGVTVTAQDGAPDARAQVRIK